jgi:hypothetical protein
VQAFLLPPLLFISTRGGMEEVRGKWKDIRFWRRKKEEQTDEQQ